jgi:hypothetical protein
METDERQKELDGNTYLYEVSEKIMDNDGDECEIIGKTRNSINVSMKRKTDHGIDCTNWFYIKDFEKKFKKIK